MTLTELEINVQNDDKIHWVIPIKESTWHHLKWHEYTSSSQDESQRDIDLAAAW